MNSVTGRISEIKQPKGGYINPNMFASYPLVEKFGELNPEENIHPSTIGLVVDYMTRFMLGTPAEYAFDISLRGAAIAERLGLKGSTKLCTALMRNIIGTDPNSIICACKLVTFDVWYRNPQCAMRSKSYSEINPDGPTIYNIQILIKRSMNFFYKYGPIVKDGFTFEPPIPDEKAYLKMLKNGRGSYGGYTATVSSGDGDFLTYDTLWDFKVSKSKPTSKHTLQLLMYFLMGKRSGQGIYYPIYKIGIFNPRLNMVYILDMNYVPMEVIQSVERNVICYN